VAAPENSLRDGTMASAEARAYNGGQSLFILSYAPVSGLTVSGTKFSGN